MWLASWQQFQTGTILISPHQKKKKWKQVKVNSIKWSITNESLAIYFQFRLRKSKYLPDSFYTFLLLLLSHSVVSNSLWPPWTAACQASLSFTISWSLFKFMSIESVMPSNHFILCCPLLLLPSIFPSIRDFSKEWALCMRWPKYWSLSFRYQRICLPQILWYHCLPPTKKLQE